MRAVENLGFRIQNLGLRMRMQSLHTFTFFSISIIVAFVFFAPYAHAESADLTSRARAILLVEADHGGVLLAKSPALELPIASLTKLMTALVFLDAHPNWQRLIRIRSEDIRSSGRGVLVAGDQISLKDLFTVALIRSDNTAAQSLVTASGMSEEAFVAAMNAKAHAMGLDETSFVESTGLDPKNMSTARDLVRLAHAAFVQPTIAGMLRQPSATVSVLPAGKKIAGKKKVYSTNIILGKHAKSFQVVEGKTGTTDEAGYSFIVHAQTAEKPQRNLFAVILSATSARERFDLALDLLTFGTTQLTQFPPAESPRDTVLHSAAAR